MKTGIERRQSPRFASSFPLRYRLIPVSGTGYLEGAVADLSAGGVRFQASSGIRPRAGFLFELLVPGSEPVRSFGRAAWVRPVPGKDGVFEVGSSFVDQSTASRKAIERHLQHEPVLAAC